MPTRPCAEWGCPHPARRGRARCEVHDKARERERSARRRQEDEQRKVYARAKWANTRRHVLHQQPLCVCGRIATDVDHVVPMSEGGAAFDLANLQSLCHACHGEKSWREQLARRN